MLDVLGKLYYVDFAEIENLINMPESNSEEMTINIVSYDIIKMMIEVVITERDEIDETLGIHSANKLSIPFKVAFNTLLRYNILKSLT
jgi:hypothetical protein